MVVKFAFDRIDNNSECSGIDCIEEMEKKEFEGFNHRLHDVLDYYMTIIERIVYPSIAIMLALFGCIQCCRNSLVGG